MNHPEVTQQALSILRSGETFQLGYKPEQIAEMQAVSKPTIYGWINRWRSGGVEGLANRPKSGR